MGGDDKTVVSLILKMGRKSSLGITSTLKINGLSFTKRYTIVYIFSCQEKLNFSDVQII